MQADPKQPEMPRQTGSARHVGCDALLGIWWSSMPDWAKHAYRNDQTVNRVMKECAYRETEKAEMLWRLAGALYEQRNQLRDTVIHMKESEPIVVMMPNAKLTDRR